MHGEYPLAPQTIPNVAPSNIIQIKVAKRSILIIFEANLLLKII